MDKNNRSNETLLDFSCIFWGFIDQWKAILFFSLIFSLLITGLKYRSDSLAYDAAVSASKESVITAEQAAKQIEDILGTLSNEDKAAVDYALGFHSLISDKYKYQTESPIMNIDHNHTEVLTITYRIEGDIDHSLRSTLNDGYITTFNDQSALETISEAVSKKIAPEYIKELISFSDPYAGLSQVPASIIQDDNSFNVFVIIPKNASPDLIETAVTDVIKKRCRDLSVSIVPHTIDTVSSGTSTSVCNGVQVKQSDVYYSISYLKGSLDTAISGLSPSQSAAYSTLIQLQNIINGNAEVMNNVTVADPIKPGVSKQFLFIGFILGILLYFFAFTIYLVLSSKIVSAKVAERVIHKRILGEYYNNVAKSSIISKLFHSPAIFNLRHRDMTDLEKQASEVSQSLDVISSREKISNIMLINTYSEQDTFTDSIKKACNSDGISLNVLQQTDINDEAFKDVSNAIISVSNNTRINKLYSVIDLLDYYHINILGFVYTASH